MQYVIKFTKPDVVFSDSDAAHHDRMSGFSEALLENFRATNTKYNVSHSHSWDQGTSTLTVVKAFPEGATNTTVQDYVFELSSLDPVDNVNGWSKTSENIIE